MAAISTALTNKHAVTNASERRENVPLKSKPALKRQALTAAQIEIVGQFNDYAWENPG